MRGSWNWRKQDKLKRYIESEEVATLPEPALNASWDQIIATLPPALRRIAAHGIPAHGTRTRWMLAMARHLGESRSPEQAADLLVRWIREKPHASEDIELDRERIIIEAAEMARKQHPGGVPVRVWQRVRRLVTWTYLLTQDPLRLREVDKGNTPMKPQLLVLGDVLLTAFSILQGFYKSRRPTRKTHHRYFGQHSNSPNASDIQLVLTHKGKGNRGWLIATPNKSIPSVASREYSLMERVWLRRPGEPPQYFP
jgi:hypothetical protein